MADEWTWTPLIGAGPLRFGMTRSDVANYESILGKVNSEFEQQDANAEPLTQASRDREAPIIYFKKGS